jgi:hypothetical protein
VAIRPSPDPLPSLTADRAKRLVADFEAKQRATDITPQLRQILESAESMANRGGHEITSDYNGNDSPEYRQRLHKALEARGFKAKDGRSGFGEFVWVTW